MNHKMLLLITSLCGAVAIGSPARADLNVSPEMQKLLDAKDDKRCQQIGAKPGTDVYVTCRLQLMQSREKGYVVMAPAPTQPEPPPPYPVIKPYQLPMPTRPPRTTSTDCATNVIGSTILTHCQ